MPDTLPWLDLADPGFSTRGAQVHAARARHWCARTPYGLAVLRHREVGLLLRERRLRQGSHAWPAHQGVTGRFADWWGRILLNLEGAAHARLRRAVEPLFAPARIAAHLPGFEATAERLAHGLLSRGRGEVMADFAEPYAAAAICRVLGLGTPPDRLARHATEMGLALGVDYARHRVRVEAAFAALEAEADDLLAQHAAGAALPVVAELVAAGLGRDAIRDMIVLAVFGGVDTTRSQIGLAVSVCLDHPEHWRRLGESPAHAAAVIEEVMRLRPTTTWVTREAVEDFAFQGIAIAAGTTLHLLTEAAGTDPRACPQAGFDPDSRRRAHFGFGGGRHHCLGAHLARADMAVALRVLARRLGPIAADGPADWLPDSGNTGPARLAIRLLPRAAAEEGGPTRPSSTRKDSA